MKTHLPFINIISRYPHKGIRVVLKYFLQNQIQYHFSHAQMNPNKSLTSFNSLTGTYTFGTIRENLLWKTSSITSIGSFKKMSNSNIVSCMLTQTKVLDYVVMASKTYTFTLTEIRLRGFREEIKVEDYATGLNYNRRSHFIYKGGGEWYDINKK